MKHTFTIILFCSTIILYSQEHIAKEEIKDSIQTKQEANADSLTIFEEFYMLQKQYNDLKQSYIHSEEELREQKELLKNKSDSIIVYQKEIIKHEENNRKTNYLLINSSFYYIRSPYDASNIKKIAIPVFDAINDADLKLEHKVRKILLQKYEEDSKDLLRFLESLQEEINKLDRLSGGNFGKEKVDEMKETTFYRRYKDFEGYDKTYIGMAIIEIERRLNDHHPNDNAKFDDMISELKKALNS